MSRSQLILILALNAACFGCMENRSIQPESKIKVGMSIGKVLEQAPDVYLIKRSLFDLPSITTLSTLKDLSQKRFFYFKLSPSSNQVICIESSRGRIVSSELDTYLDGYSSGTPSSTKVHPSGSTVTKLAEVVRTGERIYYSDIEVNSNSVPIKQLLRQTTSINGIFGCPVRTGDEKFHTTDILMIVSGRVAKIRRETKPMTDY